MIEVWRGDIFYADLRPTRGSEQGGIRPVLILQNNTGNKHSPTVIAAAITASRKKARLPTHVPLDGLPMLRQGSIVMLEQIRTIDKTRLLDYIRTASTEIMEQVDTALAVSVGGGVKYSEENMLTFIIGMMAGGIAGFFAFCLLTVGKGSDRYKEESGRASFEDAQYVQIRDTGTEVRSDDSQ